jgi:hypothetical protein
MYKVGRCGVKWSKPIQHLSVRCTTLKAYADILPEDEVRHEL